MMMMHPFEFSHSIVLFFFFFSFFFNEKKNQQQTNLEDFNPSNLNPRSNLTTVDVLAVWCGVVFLCMLARVCNNVINCLFFLFRLSLARALQIVVCNRLGNERFSQSYLQRDCSAVLN